MGFRVSGREGMGLETIPIVQGVGEKGRTERGLGFIEGVW